MAHLGNGSSPPIFACLVRRITFQPLAAALFLTVPSTMSFLSWIVLGLIAGYVGSKIVNRKGEEIILDIMLGVVGAFAGGWLFPHLRQRGRKQGSSSTVSSLAVVGSVVVLVLYHAVFRRNSWSNGSSSAADTASGFSRGMKCPTPAMTRRARRETNASRSAGGESAGGRAIPSSAP